MTHIYCTTAVSIDTHTGGKHSAEQTQTVDTLLYPDELLVFFILGYHDSAPSTKSNKIVTLDFYPLEITCIIVFISSYPKHFFFFTLQQQLTLALKFLNTHNVKIIVSFRCTKDKGGIFLIFLGWQSCTLALHFSMVLNEWISGLPIFNGSRSMSRLQADFNGDYYWDKSPMRDYCWKGNG